MSMRQPNISTRLKKGGSTAPRRCWTVVTLAALIGAVLVADADLMPLLASAAPTATTSTVAGIRVPAGKSPARVLRSRTLDDGTKVIVVPAEDTFLLNGQRAAYVNEYSCVKTVRTAGKVSQYRASCLPEVEVEAPAGA
ncbi:hypothetical protein [Nocardia sp. NPDC049149]|uniref:hypothetical protein n=1 Tax=Nocardia sp. NPDC049149 TaxID=3364315 RepID=UPI003716D243